MLHAIENMILNKELKRRIITLSYKHKLSHLGSCLTAADIIDTIFEKKLPNERFVLSAGHMGLALYCVLEKYGYGDAEKIFLHHGVHPDRCGQCHLDCSTGSLGHGIGIAVGMALANREKNVSCVISDGECAEGSVSEALRIANQYGLVNLEIHVNWNGWAAYQNTDRYYIPVNDAVVYSFYIHRTNFNPWPFLKGQDAHYHVLTQEEYEAAIC